MVPIMWKFPTKPWLLIEAASSAPGGAKGVGAQPKTQSRCVGLKAPLLGKKKMVTMALHDR